MADSVSHSLTELLKQREECFVTVWECEQKLREILPDFPLPPPPDLPSRRKKVKGQALPCAPDTAKQTPPRKRELRLRELSAENGENAYRLCFIYAGKRDESFQQETSLVNAMINMNTEDFRLLSVETVSFTSADEWKACDMLWHAADSETSTTTIDNTTDDNE